MMMLPSSLDTLSLLLLLIWWLLITIIILACQIKSAICFLRGKAYEALDNRDLARQWYLCFFLLKLIAYFKIASSSVLYWIICYAILLKKYFSFPLVSGTRLPLKLTLYVTRWEHWLLNNWYYYPCYHKRSCTIT